jgi:hypothetical protein
MGIQTISVERCEHLSHFRRRTWSVVAVCLMLRIASGALDGEAHFQTPAAKEPAACAVGPFKLTKPVG